MSEIGENSGPDDEAASERSNASDSGGNPYAPPVEGLRTKLQSQLSLPLAFLLLAILVASFFVSVPLGIGLVLLAVPAYARAVNRSSHRIAEGRTVTSLDRLFGFLGSVAVVVVCAIAGGVAFFATCTGGIMILNGPFSSSRFGGEAVLYTLLVLCGLGFLFAACSIYISLWPSRSKSTRVVSQAGSVPETEWVSEVEQMNTEDEASD